MSDRVERVATWVPALGVAFLGVTGVVWVAFLAALFVASDPTSALVFGAACIITTVSAFPMSLRVTLDRDGNVTVTRLLGSVRFPVEAVSSIRPLRLWERRRLAPQYEIRFGDRRVAVDRGPFGQRAFLDAVEELNQQARVRSRRSG